MPYHILQYKLPTPENVDVVQRKTLQKKETSFFDPHLTPLDKMEKCRNIIAHPQDIPNHILKYHLSDL